MTDTAEATAEARLDVEAVRARYTALDRRLAFFDGPGGTQCPDEVIDAISRYLREDNANIGAPYETSRRTDALVDAAHERAASFLGCDPGEVAFGQSMTALNFLLTRAFARTLQPGDEVLVTRLDHDANVAPWLEIQRDLGIDVRFVDVTDDLALDYEDLERQLSERTRVVAFPAAANSVGTAPDVRRVVDLAHGAGRARLGRRRPLRAARADRRRRVGLRRADLLAVQVLRAAHGTRVRPGGVPAEPPALQGATGRGRAGRAPLRARHVPARAARGLRRGGGLRRVDRLGRDPRAREPRWDGDSSTAFPEGVALHGLPTMDGPRSHVLLQRPRADCRARSPSTSRGATSPCGGATTTRSRRCGGSASTRSTAPSGRESSTTTRPRRSTGWPTASRSSFEGPPPRRAEVPRPRGDRRGSSSAATS